jgi:BarA-like signal transduction histidine kinase
MKEAKEWIVAAEYAVLVLGAPPMLEVILAIQADAIAGERAMAEELILALRGACEALANVDRHLGLLAGEGVKFRAAVAALAKAKGQS